METSLYAGDYERVTKGGQTWNIHYVSGPEGLTAMIVINGNNQYIHYVFTDHLGSILKTTDPSGNTTAEQSFDAWGRYRNPATWVYDDTYGTRPDWLIRGYTGHEHLRAFALIHMNARLYDPIVSRMLSPDNYVANGDATQDFNRYSYCVNNPLKYRDPSGNLYVIDDFIVAVASFVGGYISNGIMTGDWGTQSVGVGLKWAATGWLALNTGGLSLSPQAATNMGANFVLTQVVNGMFPSFPINITDNLSLEVSPFFLFGTEQVGSGIRISANVKSGNKYIHAQMLGMNYSKTFGSTVSVYESQFTVGGGFDDGKYGIGLNMTRYNSGETSQTLGGINMKFGDHSVYFQNDWPLGDGGDRFRTAALRYSYKDFHAGFNLFTGDPGLKSGDRRVKDIEGNGILSYIKSGSNDPDKYRAGVAYLGVGSYSFGRNSEQIRHLIQNEIIHKNIGFPYFKVIGVSPSYYFRYGSNNKWSLW